MKRNLAVIWSGILAAGATVVGVLTGRRRRRRAERERAREERRAKRAQRKAQGGRKRSAAAARTSPRPSGAGQASTASGTTAAAEGTSEAAGVGAAEGSGAAEAAAGAAASEGDDLQAIKGLGAVAAGKLREAGVTTYAQIAAWTPEEAHEIAVRLELQPGRVAGDDWVGQARQLLEGSGKDS